jgi:archaemetzincin
MKTAILTISQVSPQILLDLAEALPKIFPDTSCSIIKNSQPIPTDAYSRRRNQYNSSIILNQIRVYAGKQTEFDRVLGVIDFDLFSLGLNYVFGEAYTPGQTALISLWRLKPEFYGEAANPEVYHLRALKEAVHELGHTLGLNHCPRSRCVMHFSNSIFDTDRKQSLFCEQDYLQAALAIDTLGRKHD